MPLQSLPATTREDHLPFPGTTPRGRTARRTVLRALAVGGAAAPLALLSAPAAEASTTRRPVRRPVAGPVRHPVAPQPVAAPSGNTSAEHQHVLLRTTFGSTPALLAEIDAEGTAAWLDAQLAPTTLDDSACDAALARWPLAQASGPTVHRSVTYGDTEASVQLVEATLARQLWSRRQLLEVVMGVWSDHFNITTPSSEVWATKPSHDALLRAHALGRFEDLLVGTMLSPAMLLFLNAAQSTAAAPNENHGRELLELHTVGIDTGYSHDDVLDAARALTGLGSWSPYNGGTPENFGTLRYSPSDHYVGALQVLDWSSANSTAADGQSVVRSLGHYLAHHPATASRVAHKLAVRFVSDSPSDHLVAELASTYLANDTAIVPVLRALFASAEFLASARVKVRRPREDVLAAARALDLRPADSSSRSGLQDLLAWLRDLGDAPLGWPMPDGYPDTAAAWCGPGTTLGRWNVHTGLGQQWFKAGLTPCPDLPTLLLGAHPPTRTSALVTTLFARLVPRVAVPQAEVSAVVTFLGGDRAVTPTDLGALFSVIVSLVLGGPSWIAR